jgi:hypothetical protein
VPPSAFVPGLELSRRLHAQVVGPLLAGRLPGLRYAAGRLDSGSELLGFDTPRSADHDWGPRLQVFVAEADAGRRGEVEAVLPAGVRDGVTVTTVAEFFAGRLGVDPRAGMRTVDWLAAPTQRLAELTGGAVWHDGLPGRGLTAARAALAWYPDDVWRYVLAAHWTRVAQHEHLMGRAGEAGDELGSAMIAARLARDLVRLCLLLARRYPPYDKWLGSAFARLPDAGPVADALAATTRLRSAANPLLADPNER